MRIDTFCDVRLVWMFLQSWGGSPAVSPKGEDSGSSPSASEQNEVLRLPPRGVEAVHPSHIISTEKKQVQWGHPLDSDF
jgi:hypothetical protein